ncbi:MAG: hypothetical protein K0R66_1772 [Gammaproteobacteria bacterium]|jgi:hypothetical protein|nr:hypothetical protein [Gammaproteobacteria bacterium]
MPASQDIKDILLSKVELYALLKLRKKKKLSPEIETRVHKLFQPFIGTSNYPQNWTQFTESVVRELRDLDVLDGRVRELLMLLEAIQAESWSNSQDPNAFIADMKKEASFGLWGARGSVFFKVLELSPSTSQSAINGRERIKKINNAIEILEGPRKSHILISDAKVREAYIGAVRAVPAQTSVTAFPYSDAKNHLLYLLGTFQKVLHKPRIRHGIKDASLPKPEERRPSQSEGASVAKIAAYIEMAKILTPNIEHLVKYVFQDCSLSSDAITKSLANLIELNEKLEARTNTLKSELYLLRPYIYYGQILDVSRVNEEFAREISAKLQLLLLNFEKTVVQFQEISRQLASHAFALFKAYAEAGHREFLQFGVSPQRCREAIFGMLTAIKLIKENESLRDQLKKEANPFFSLEPKLEAFDTPEEHDSRVKAAKELYEKTADAYVHPTTEKSDFLMQDIRNMKDIHAEFLRTVEKLVENVAPTPAVPARPRPLPPMPIARIRLEAAGGSGTAGPALG